MTKLYLKTENQEEQIKLFIYVCVMLRPPVETQIERIYSSLSTMFKIMFLHSTYFYQFHHLNTLLFQSIALAQAFNHSLRTIIKIGGPIHTEKSGSVGFSF